jgi:hypothetical protein
MTGSENKAIVERYLQRAWNERDWSAAEETVDENVIFHDQVREGDPPPVAGPHRRGARISRWRTRRR